MYVYIMYEKEHTKANKKTINITHRTNIIFVSIEWISSFLKFKG
jgi:hypothetical protein